MTDLQESHKKFLNNNPELVKIMVEVLEEYQETPQAILIRPGATPEQLAEANLLYNAVEGIKIKLTNLAEEAG